MKNNLRYGVLALAMAATVSIFPAMSVSAAGRKAVDPYAGVEYETIQTPKDESMADYVKGLTMLTEAEKKQLVDESVAAQPMYDKISALEEKIDAKTNQILMTADPLFDERGAIFDKYEALWDKLKDNMNEKQNQLTNYMDIIKASTALTAKEKATLTKAQARLDKIEKEIATYYDKAEKATKDLTAQRDKEIENLQKLYAKSAHIWKKVYGE